MLDAHPSIWGIGEESVLGPQIALMQRELKEVLKVEEDKQNIDNAIFLGDADTDQNEVSCNEEPIFDNNSKLSSSCIHKNKAYNFHSDNMTEKLVEENFKTIIDKYSSITEKKMLSKAYEFAQFETSNENMNGINNITTFISNARIQNKGKVIDKMLFNYQHINLIHLLFPKAMILHTVRDPLDTLFSCWKTRFNNDDYFNQPSVYDRYENRLKFDNINTEIGQLLTDDVNGDEKKKFEVNNENVRGQYSDQRKNMWTHNITAMVHEYVLYLKVRSTLLTMSKARFYQKPESPPSWLNVLQNSHPSTKFCNVQS